jgi:hypothetical protein
MFIGDGAKLVRDAFALAKEKQPAIIFIDELDAIGTKVCTAFCSRCLADIPLSIWLIRLFRLLVWLGWPVAYPDAGAWL